jgi:hypothetical protein
LVNGSLISYLAHMGHPGSQQPELMFGCMVA